MFQNYMSTALRVIARHKLYSFINIFSLTLGLCAALLIHLFVEFEKGYDSHWPDSDRIYRATTHYSPPGAAPLYDAWSPYRLRQLLLDNYPEIEAAGLGSPTFATFKPENEGFVQQILAADEGFFSVFPFEGLDGEALPALEDPLSLYISEKTALKYFGTVDPVGKTVDVDTGFADKFEPFIIRGVFKDSPANSHLQVEMIRLVNQANWNPDELSWIYFSHFNYFKIHETAHIEDINARIIDVIDENIKSSQDPSLVISEILKFSFLPLNALHFDDARGEISGFLAPARGDKATVDAMTWVGLIILVIAAINFINLTTARASLRAKEVALRKTLGSDRHQLIFQFLGESTLYAVFGAVLALGIVFAITPWFSSVLDRDIVLSLADILPQTLGLIVGLGLLGGLYPAFYLSRFQPADVLRANRSGSNSLSLRLRQALVVFQFAASVALIIATFIIYQQTEYARNLDDGYELDNQIILDRISRLPGDNRVERSALLRDRLNAIPGVQSATLAWALPSEDLTRLFTLKQDGREENYSFEAAYVDPYFDDVFGLRLLAGRFLDPEIETDRFKGAQSKESGASAVLNRAAAEAMGINDPQEAIGRILSTTAFDSETRERVDVAITIVGVVENLQFGSVREASGTAIYVYNPRLLFNAAIRFSGRQGPEIFGQAKQIWDELVPEFPFIGSYMDEDIANLYRGDEQRASAFAAFSLLATLIALIGLFGLALFSMEQRQKEISIRRVLGAKTAQITGLISWQFSRLVLLANILGWPIAYWVSNNWLETFARRIELGLLPFVITTALAFGLAWICVALLTLRQARRSPVTDLRSE